MATPFHPPDPTIHKPEVPEWIPPEPTKADLDWAQLRTIDLSLLDSPDPSVVSSLILTTKQAIKEDGFLYVTNYGISLSQLHRQFSLAQYMHSNISESDKQRLLWEPSSGTFAGYKPPLGWKREQGDYDGISHFNFYSPQFQDNKVVPECLQPFMDEITAFCDYLNESVTRRLLTLLSRVLQMPDDYLWNTVLSPGRPVGEGYFRHALYHPLPPSLRQKREGVRMYGHRDYGCLTLLFSVPVSALQIFGRDNKWRYAKYNPGAIVVNLGEGLEIVSGGHFKATLHKVADTPPDQADTERLSLVYFSSSRGGLRLKPEMDSPLLQREGLVLDGQGVFREYKAVSDAGVPVPTNKEWREAQISRRLQLAPKERSGGRKVIDGVEYGEDTFMGVKVLLPV